MLTFEQIKELIELVSRRQLQGLELERSGFRLKIDGYVSSNDAVAPTAVAGPQTAAEPSLTDAAQSQGGGAEASATEPEEALEGLHTLKSPIVGTFYRAPSPGSDPFVNVGDQVKKGQVLCIVEAMKLMNEIEADVDGLIAKILVENAQPVEFGEPLFAIKTG